MIFRIEVFILLCLLRIGVALGFFSIFRSRRLTILWEFQTHGTLWRLLPARGGLFVGEDRSPATKTVTFFCLQERDGSLLWNNLRLDEPWWVGIEAIHGNLIFFHEFARPDLPEHHKIIAADLRTGRILWNSEELKFLFARESVLYAAKDSFETRLFYEVNAETGSVLRELGDDASYMNVLREASTTDPEIEVDFPEPLQQLEWLDNQRKSLLKRHLGRHVNLEEVEVLVKNSLAAVAYYENMKPNTPEAEFNQHLKIIDLETNSLLIEDVLTLGAKAVVPDRFFSRGTLLFYLKNRNIVRAINIA